jgi:hypothetical protein
MLSFRTDEADALQRSAGRNGWELIARSSYAKRYVGIFCVWLAKTMR